MSREEMRRGFGQDEHRIKGPTLFSSDGAAYQGRTSLLSSTSSDEKVHSPTRTHLTEQLQVRISRLD